MSISKLKYRHGLRDGLPIGLGYLSVSFGFGISAIGRGIGVFASVLISMTNLTSAGQVAGVAVIASALPLYEMMLTQLIINIRYSLMGLTLTQKLDDSFSTLHRLAAAFFITDEIYAVASSKKDSICPAYVYGLGTLPWIGWTLGTLLGAAAGAVLPESISGALGIAIYGMFIAIVVPAAKKERGILVCAVSAAAMSCALKYIPLFSFITQGFAIIICALAAAALAALLFPVKEAQSNDG